ncbi:MAG: gliding motility-associated C-terminal domain-containing protein, partial [Lentisphaeria bacterium]|nr:gliding motility-associated C-terminal domain-containing protein [Lentisphaeria bacterium]
ASGSCPQEEVITRTWTATDDCGNASSCDQVVTVVDDEAPAITCPANSTVECMPSAGTADCLGGLATIAASTGLGVTGSATATDNCGTPAIDFSDSVAAGSCPQEKEITRTWTATDDCGNSSDCDQAITVVDDEAPAITCPASVTVNCEDDSSSTGTGSASATDNCDSNVTFTESDSSAAGSCADEKVITRTWTATDDCGNNT